MKNYYKDNYSSIVEPVLEKSEKVVIDDEMIEKIRQHAIERAEYKKKEYDHMIDNDREVERTVTGLMGEAALEKLLGLTIIDWTFGDSSKYNKPDISLYNVGVKTVEKGKYPIISKKNKYPQIFCVRDVKNPNLVYVCGMASVDTLNTCQSDDLILNWKLRAKGYKTGFYGFDKLTTVKTIDDIKNRNV